MCLMKIKITFLILFILSFTARGQNPTISSGGTGYENRIRSYIDSLKIIDTHEHLLDPQIIKGSYFLDFSLLFQQNGYDDLVSAGMPDSLFDDLFNEPLSPVQKWKLIEPYWGNSFNTSFNRIILLGINKLF